MSLMFFLCLFFILQQYQVYRKDANAQSSKYQSMQGLHLAFIIDGNMVMLYMCFVFITLNHITILPLI